MSKTPSFFWPAMGAVGLVLYTAATGDNRPGDVIGIHNTGDGNLHIGFLPALVIGVVLVALGWQFTRTRDLFLRLIGWALIAVVVILCTGHSPEEIGAAILKAGGR